MDNSNITISSDFFMKIFVKNSTIDCVSKDKQIENDLSKLCSNQVTLCFISNYIQKKINDLMIEQYRCLNSNNHQAQFNDHHYNGQYYSEPVYDSHYSNQATKNVGRLGPAHVQFDLNSLIGQITIDRYTNTLMSNSGFSTIKANCFLYSGKFQYEVLLLTKGIMQLGFASTSQSGAMSGAMCNFTLEKGVGDSLNSYSYDGNRQKKWNLNSAPYGEKWEINDVISCCIDLDNCTVSFYRNGKFLGIAFDKIQTGSGIVYFPAISLAFNERIIVNFGSSRFKYQIEGYEPLEIQNEFDIIKSNMLIEWLFNLILLKCQTSEEENIYQNVHHQEEIYQNLGPQASNSAGSQKSSPIKSSGSRSENPFFYLTTSLIMEELESLLTNEYIIETCLFKHLILYHTKNEIHCFLDIIWSLLNETNLDLFFNSIVLIIVYGFQFSQFHDEEILFSELNYSASTYSTFHPSSELTSELSFVSQKQYLYLFLLLIQHKRTRIYFLNNVLFKKNLFFQLLDTKLIFDNNMLQKHLFPNLTLHDLNNHFNQLKLNCNLPTNADSSNYACNETCTHQSCSYNQTVYTAQLQSHLHSHPAANNTASKSNKSNHQIWRNLELENSLLELESLQNMVIDTLLFQDELCRTIFIDKFSTFLTELERQFINNRSIATNTFATPLSVLLSVFHRLCSLIRNQYDNVITCFPLDFFVDTKYCSKNTLRIGGLYNHLEKNHQKEISIYYNFELSNTNPLLMQVFVLIYHLIRLYSVGVHKQLGKYNGIKELLIEFNNSIHNLDKLREEQHHRERNDYSSSCLNNGINNMNHHVTLNKSNSFTNSLSDNLRRTRSLTSSTNQLADGDAYRDDCRDSYFAYSKSVLESDYLTRGHQYALLNGIVFTDDRRQDIIWLLKIILQTLDQASSSGCILSYLPHYLITGLNLCTALRFYFGDETHQPLNSLSSSNAKLSSSLNNKTHQNLEYNQVLKLHAMFITAHFCDERIITSEHKELIANQLTSLITSKQGLNILENISIENRLNLIKKLTLPFENRSWINSNWILLRFWKGSGFAFKKETFIKLSNSLSDENLNFFTKNDLISNSNDVNPSLVFQQLLCDYFNSNQKQAFIFLTSLLNQLNFSFSEFVNSLSDIQNSSIRQDCLKICCTCYDLSNALLRVLEMIIHYNASLIQASNSISTCVSKCGLNPNEHLFSNENYESTKLKSYFGIVDEDNGFSFDNAFGLNSDGTCHFSGFDNGGSFDTSSFNANFEGNNFKIEKPKIGGNKERMSSMFGSNRESNEILLQQLCSICNQILNRVQMSSKCFKYVRQQLTNLDSMNEFNILSSVAAVLIELIVKNERTRYLTLNLLINDLNFQLSSFLYLVGESKVEKCCFNMLGTSDGARCCSDQSSNNRKKTTNTSNFIKYLNDDELKDLKRMLIYIVNYNERNEKLKLNLNLNLKDEDLCTICYANNKKEALFIPCLHSSCKNCISIHFLRNSECFFCKIPLEKVQFIETNQVLYPQKVKAKSS